MLLANLLVLMRIEPAGHDDKNMQLMEPSHVIYSHAVVYLTGSILQVYRTVLYIVLYRYLVNIHLLSKRLYNHLYRKRYTFILVNLP